MPTHEIDLASMSGAWPAITVSGATGAGSGMNLAYAIEPGLIQGKANWKNGTKTIERASNGDWLIKSGSTVLYRKTGSKAWPWTSGTWTGENSGTGTIAMVQSLAAPREITSIDDASGGLLPRLVVTGDITGSPVELILVPGSDPIEYTGTGASVTDTGIEYRCLNADHEMWLMTLRDDGADTEVFETEIGVLLPQGAEYTASAPTTGSIEVTASVAKPVSITV
jgi:hypothetical protein